MSAGSTRYVVISPVKDEEQYIEITIRAMIQQTILPSLWTIVDDGSCDRTPEIVEHYARKHSWIRLQRIRRDTERRLGSAEIRAFQAGYELVRDVPSDFIVKFDGDLDFGADYFERLIQKFNEDEKLGIASGVYFENEGDDRHQRMPVYHASGASKMIRAKCFEEIGGFVLYPGWDTVDEIKAQSRGWKTRHFEEVPFLHLKPEGSASGARQTNLLHGRVYYVSGGGKLFFLLKVVNRMWSGRPILWGGLTMLWGFLGAWLVNTPLLVSQAETRFYRRLLNRRIAAGIKRAVTRARLNGAAESTSAGNVWNLRSF
jgi:glycosyltransferase involved in cell wall biosynthesis